MLLTIFTSITRELLFAQLRASGLFHLGQVKRLYMEANGEFTLIEDPKPGLSILPEWDTEFVDQQDKAPGQNVCYVCGNLKPDASPAKAEKCTKCGKNEWVPALK